MRIHIPSCGPWQMTLPEVACEETRYEAVIRHAEVRERFGKAKLVIWFGIVPLWCSPSCARISCDPGDPLIRNFLEALGYDVTALSYVDSGSLVGQHLVIRVGIEVTHEWLLTRKEISGVSFAHERRHPQEKEIP